MKVKLIFFKVNNFCEKKEEKVSRLRSEAMSKPKPKKEL